MTSNQAWINMDSTFGTDDALLRCPICTDGCGDNQHHGRVEIFERVYGEDGPSVVFDSHTGMWRDTEKNPSSRRNAVRVHMWGECDHRWWFDIVQHKGATSLEAGWEEKP